MDTGGYRITTRGDVFSCLLLHRQFPTVPWRERVLVSGWTVDGKRTHLSVRVPYGLTFWKWVYVSAGLLFVIDSLSGDWRRRLGHQFPGTVTDGQSTSVWIEKNGRSSHVCLLTHASGVSHPHPAPTTTLLPCTAPHYHTAQHVVYGATALWCTASSGNFGAIREWEEVLATVTWCHVTKMCCALSGDMFANNNASLNCIESFG